MKTYNEIKKMLSFEEVKNLLEENPSRKFRRRCWSDQKQHLTKNRHGEIIITDGKEERNYENLNPQLWDWYEIMPDPVNHPAHYGGTDNPFEPIKIIEHYDLNFSLGNVIKYTLRAGKKMMNLKT